jgi:outer membrane immunogenic protein
MKTKALLSLVFLIGIGSSASAQFTRGDKLLGGSLQISAGKMRNRIPDIPDPKSSSIAITLNPSLGFFTSPTSLHGFTLISGYSHSESSNSNGDESKGRFYSLGAGYFFRKFKTLSDKFGLFGQLRAGYIYSWDKTTNQFSGVITTIKSRYHNAYASADVGIYYQIHKKILADATFGAASLNYQYVPLPDEIKRHAVFFNTGLSSGISLGIYLILSK